MSDAGQSAAVSPEQRTAPETSGAPEPAAQPSVSSQAAVEPPVLSADAPIESATEETPKSPWPDNWASVAAKDDENFLKFAKRYASPESALRAFYDLRKQIGAGLLQEVLPPDAGPERVAEYRQKVGIPEAPEGYGLKFPDGMQVPEEKQQELGFFLKRMHDINAHPKVVNEAWQTYLTLSEAEAQRRYDHAVKTKEDTKVSLRVEWGRDYDRNMNLAKRFTKDVAGEDGEEMLRWQLADGTALGDHPEFIRAMANAGHKIVAHDPSTYGDTEAGGKSPEERLNELMDLQNTDWRRYQSKEVQTELVSVMQRVQARRQQRGRAA